jgi:hypothetical protein
MKTQQRAKFLEGPGKRCLALASMVLFLDIEGAVKHVGVVVRRDLVDMSAEWEYLTVGVQLVDDSLGQFLKAFPPDFEGRESQLNRRSQRLAEHKELTMGKLGNSTVGNMTGSVNPVKNSTTNVNAVNRKGMNNSLRQPPVAAYMFQVLIFNEHRL